MQRIRYTGPDEARVVALPGGGITFDRMKWLDLEAEAAKHGIGAHHIPIVQRGLLIGDDWEAETRTRKTKTNDEESA